MLAEMEYNHQKIEMEDENVGKIVVKEGEQNDTSNSDEEEEVVLHCPETEQIRQRYHEHELFNQYKVAVD
jgi:hypothetical protein